MSDNVNQKPTENESVEAIEETVKDSSNTNKSISNMKETSEIKEIDEKIPLEKIDKNISKGYPCPICGKVLKRKSGLGRHQNSKACLRARRIEESKSLRNRINDNSDKIHIDIDNDDLEEFYKFKRFQQFKSTVAQKKVKKIRTKPVEPIEESESEYECVELQPEPEEELIENVEHNYINPEPCDNIFGVPVNFC